MLLKTPDQVPHISGLREIDHINGIYRIQLEKDTSPQEILKKLVGMEFQIDSYQIAVPTLNEIFIKVVHGDHDRS